MADTLGGLVDKLNTIDFKLWNSQEILYEIRRMSFEEYKEKYFDSENGAKLIWEILKKTCDLNVQRNALIDEIDEKIVQMINLKFDGGNLDNGEFIQKKYKTL